MTCAAPRPGRCVRPPSWSRRGTPSHVSVGEQAATWGFAAVRRRCSQRRSRRGGSFVDSHPRRARRTGQTLRSPSTGRRAGRRSTRALAEHGRTRRAGRARPHMRSPGTLPLSSRCICVRVIPSGRSISAAWSCSASESRSSALTSEAVRRLRAARRIHLTRRQSAQCVSRPLVSALPQSPHVGGRDGTTGDLCGLRSGMRSSSAAR